MDIGEEVGDVGVSDNMSNVKFVVGGLRVTTDVVVLVKLVVLVLLIMLDWE